MSRNHQQNQRSINILIPGKLGTRNEIYSQRYEIWHSEQAKFVNQKYRWNCRSWPKNEYFFGLKIAMCLILMKSGNQSKLNMLTMNILIAIDDLDCKLEVWESWSQTEMRSTFYEFWHLRQIKHADYEYSTWNW